MQFLSIFKIAAAAPAVLARPRHASAQLPTRAFCRPFARVGRKRACRRRRQCRFVCARRRARCGSKIRALPKAARRRRAHTRKLGVGGRGGDLQAPVLFVEATNNKRCARR